jgi:hypothetical protein
MCRFEELVFNSVNLGSRAISRSGQMCVCYVFRNVDERMNGGGHRSHVLGGMRLAAVLTSWMSALIVAGTCHSLTGRVTNKLTKKEFSRCFH